MYIGKLIIGLAMAAVTFMSCGDSRQVSKGHLNDELKLKGDLTVYGLACEGCSGSCQAR